MRPAALRCLTFDTLVGVQPIVLHPKARDAIRRFPKEVRFRLGRGLFRLQLGEQIGMPDSRPMPAVAPGVSELRAKGWTASSGSSTTRRHLGAFLFFTLSSRRPNGRHLSKWSLHENVSRSFSMPRLKPIVATTPEELAGALGLSSAAAKEWQVQHALLKRLK